MSHAVLDSPIGRLVVTATANGVSGIAWSGHPGVIDADRSSAADEVLAHATRQLEEYFVGTRRVFDIAIDRSARRGFRGEVLDALEDVSYGETITYGELARRAGRPRAARAVGTAMATNPIAVIVPCHRILPSAGGIGSYAGGTDAKALLLRLEATSD